MVRSVHLRHMAALVLTTAAVMLAATSVPAAASPIIFGAKLSTLPHTTGARSCDGVLTGGSGTYSCTWIEDFAYGAPNNNGYPAARAPQDGHINKIRLIAGNAGSFQLFIARYRMSTQQGKVVRSGPTIHYVANQGHVQVFNIDPLVVHTGDYLAIKTVDAGMLRCDQGSDHISLYKPPLAVGGAFTNANDTSGCFMLMQAQYA